MKQARMFLAIVLSFLVFIIWQHFFNGKPGTQEPIQKEPTPQQVTEDATQKSAHPEKTYLLTPVVETEGHVSPDDQTVNARLIFVENNVYSIQISEHRAAFQSFVLKEYNESSKIDSKPKELISDEGNVGTVLVNLSNNSLPGLSAAVFKASQSYTDIVVDQSPQSLSFTWVSPGGVVIEKEFTFYPDSYLIDLAVKIRNGSDVVLGDDLILSLVSKIPEAASRYGFEGPGALIGKSFEKIDYDDIEEQNRLNGMLRWISVQDRYFVKSFIPKVITQATFQLSIDQKKNLMASYILPINEIQPKSKKSYAFAIYMGPKSVKLLKTYGFELDKTVDFGFFDFIAKPCLWLMNFFYRYLPNYGVAIIILTILIKILLWPLGNKNYKSMNEMKKLQPLMAEIREKYKDDKKRMNEEIMNLYQTYKVNPLGGCLPMLPQLPVFFALYQMLYSAIELRHAPFFGWINDLSAPDRLFDFGAAFGISIPFMTPPYGIPVLTIIMGATMLISQKLQPPVGDPAQAKMMMMMPIIFTVIFVNFSSGLVLYWLVNNVLSIAQQYYVS